MLRRFEPVASVRLSRIQRDNDYQLHMGRVRRTQTVLNTTRPELSPRHRLLAERAAARRDDFLRRARENLRTVTQAAQLPYSDPLPPTPRRIGLQPELADAYQTLRFPVTFVDLSDPSFLRTCAVPDDAASARRPAASDDDDILDLESSDDESG